MIKLEKINYNHLNVKAKEIYNFQKVSSIFADYGFTTMWLNNDWEGADFIAVHNDGMTTLKVQLKGRMSFDKKYLNKDIYICFREDEQTYLYPHDELLDLIPTYKEAVEKNGFRHLKKIPEIYKHILEQYIL